MTDFNADRRQVLAGAALVGALAAAPLASAQSVAPAKPAPFTPQALPFDPKAITGLSEKLLVSHHDNNYVGAVKRLGAIDAQFAALDPAAAPTFLLNGHRVVGGRPQPILKAMIEAIEATKAARTP